MSFFPCVFITVGGCSIVGLLDRRWRSHRRLLEGAGEVVVGSEYYSFQHNYNQLQQEKKMLAELQKYHQKLISQPQAEIQCMQKLKQEYTAIFESELSKSADNYLSRHRLIKKDLQEELASIQYYLKVAQASKQPPEGQQPSDWLKILNSVNLYSLFKSIDDKIISNLSMISDFRFSCYFPLKEHNYCDKLEARARIQEEQLRQQSQFISILLSKMGRPAKQEAQSFKNMREKYQNLLKTEPVQANSQLIVKDSINFVISSLLTNKYLNKVQLSIVNQSGIHDNEDYERLGSALLNHKFYLRDIKIRLMDMEFSQQKCDTLKRYLRRMRRLEKLVLHNYYSECKLGLFVDFNWLPYKKNTNVKASSWV